MKKLLLLLFIKAAILIFLIGVSYIGLAPDEAQYWTWSQELDWGYYSKPPAIAWQIWLTTKLLGNTPLGVRFGALVISFLLSLTLYGIARRAGLSQKSAFWSGVVMAFCPLGVYLSFAATTDGGAILFLTLATLCVVYGLQEDKRPNYPLIGLCILGGALYKWTAFVFWPILLIALCFFKRLRSWTILWGFVISLCAFLPSIYWNASHEWATFRHVGTAIGEAQAGNFFDFFAAQIGLLSPIYFVLLVVSYFYLFRSKNQALIFSGIFPLSVLFYLGMAFFKKMQPNWGAYLYPPGLALIGWVGSERLKKGTIWLHFGTWLSISALCVAFLIPLGQKEGIFALSYKLNPFRQSMGWEKIADPLLDPPYHPHDDYLFGDKYQTASLLSFYSPDQRRAYFFNISASRKNQFSYWPQLGTDEKDKTGYFVVLENTNQKAISWYEQHYLGRLEPYFAEVEFKGAYPLFSVSGRPVKYAMIFACRNFSGQSPPEVIKY